MAFISQSLYFILGLGLLILVHEFGHFIMAKLNGIRVERFSIGFGPRIIHFRKGETEYCFSLLFFLGGYVKMTGQDDFATDEDDLPKIKEKDPRSFEQKSIFARLQVVLGGPVMNLLLPWILLPMVYLLGVSQPKYLSEKPLINGVQANSPAATEGILAGDTIVSMQGKETPTWEDVLWQLALNQGHQVELLINRDGTLINKKIMIEKKGEHEMPYTGFHPNYFIAPIIGKVRPDMPAAIAGLQAGDKILKINEKVITYWAEISELIVANQEKPFTLSYEREGKLNQVTLTPKPAEIEQQKIFVVGIEPVMGEVFRKYSLSEAWVKGAHANKMLLGKTLEVLGKLFTGGLSVKTLAGPVQIATGTVEAAKKGMGNFLYFLAFLSVNLGIVNLLPIPVLDGGHVVYLAYETIFRRPISLRLRLIFQQIGLVMLLTLMLFVTVNDISRQWGFGNLLEKVKHLIGM